VLLGLQAAGCTLRVGADKKPDPQVSMDEAMEAARALVDVGTTFSLGRRGRGPQ